MDILQILIEGSNRELQALATKTNSTLFELSLNYLDPKWNLSIIELRNLLKNLGPYQPLNPLRAILGVSPEEFEVSLTGQDPYPGLKIPNGYAFAVDEDQAIPQSLSRMRRELHDDLGYNVTRTLVPWRKQGILLLNSVLTVIPGGPPKSHVKKGWQAITQKILSRTKNSVFLCLGNDARELAGLVGAKRVIAVPHPSPMARGFLGSKCYTRTLEMLGPNTRVTFAGTT